MRERGQDIALLAKHYLGVHRTRYQKPELRFSTEVQEALQRHHWPGNVRELRNVIEQAVIMAQQDVIGPEHMNLLPRTPQNDPPLVGGDADQLAQAERDLVTRALNQSNWNVTHAARILGVSRDTLRYRMEKFQLIRPV